jgi:YD repeat-containing protein
VATKIIIVSATLGVLLCGSSRHVAAQTCDGYASCAIYSLYDGTCYPPLPATAYACSNSGPWSETCKVKTAACPGTPECPNCNNAGAPINLASGDTEISQTDLRIPGLGGGLTLTRTWNSVWPGAESGSRVGLFGPGWRSNFEERVFAGGDGYMKYAPGSGGFWSFGWTGQNNNTNSFAAAGPSNKAATLVQSVTNFTLTLSNGEQRIYDGTSGYLLSITDRNGNTTQLSYDASYRLTAVTDPSSRHLYFAYASPTSYLVTSVTSDVGLSLSYSYDNQGRLIQYTKPDRTTVSFQYNDPNPTLITAVVDSNGKILESHTYDSQARGLTSSRAQGIDAIQITYPLSGPGGLGQN